MPGRFPPPESGPRRLRPHLFGVFFVIVTFCFYKKKYCSYKNSSLIFTLHRHFSGGEHVFFLSTNKYEKTFFAWDSTMAVVWYAPPPDKKTNDKTLFFEVGWFLVYPTSPPTRAPSSSELFFCWTGDRTRKHKGKKRPGAGGSKEEGESGGTSSPPPPPLSRTLVF